jgi:hypothetical protein
MEYGRRETAHTRILSWFFDPIKEHGFGITLLNALLTFLNENNSTLIVREARAQFERLVSVADKGGGGRTDIWIEGTGEEKSNPTHTVPFLIVIEAKIDHSEGEDQLERYDWEIQRWIRRNSADEVKIYRIFLTPHGTLPQSRRKTKEWKAFPFLKLSALFARCLPSLKDKPAYHLLRFYLATIFKDVLQWPLPLRPEERNPYQALQYMTLLSQSRGEIR